VLGMCVPWLLPSPSAALYSAGSALCAELKGGNGSKEGAGARAGVSLSAKPLAKASVRLSGEGWTCRIVESVLTAVPGHSGDAGAVRGRM
jgi:hypothetical protein